jgi:hypothetical protein
MVRIFFPIVLKSGKKFYRMKTEISAPSSKAAKKMEHLHTIGPENQSPERLVLTRLFSAQRRLRFMRGVRAALRWFAVGAGLASLGLILLWNWNYVPGPWQWLAAAGRPLELLWLPLLLSLGGFASAWLVLPNPRQAAFRMDQLMDSQERLLTAVDWVLSEKPRTETSERLLSQTSSLLADEVRFLNEVKRLEPIPKVQYLLLTTLLVPLALLYALPPDVGLPPNTALWLGEAQVDQLTEELLKELEEVDSLENDQEKLENLLKQLENTDPNSEPTEAEKSAQRELQRMVDQMMQQSEAQEKARQLLETMAQRARESQPMTEKDKQALETLRRNLAEQGQKDTLDQAAQAWEDGEFENAAKSLESLQQEMGESAQELSQSAQEAASRSEIEGDQGQEFNATEGDQFNPDGTPKEGQGQDQGERQGKGRGQGQGEPGDGQGEPGGEPGKGTTLEEQTESGAAQGNQSLRRGENESEWLEEYQHLYPPERTEFQKSQTRVRGEAGEEGPRFRTAKEGRGAVTEPGTRDGSGGLLHYREEAENAILREDVPADYRDNVRVYFESLDKGR